MIEFIIGLFVGSFIGVAVMACCSVASRADESMKPAERREEKKENELSS